MELEQELYLKRSALLEVVDKIKILNHSKDELLENINLLENIESMKSVVDKDFEILGFDEYGSPGWNQGVHSYLNRAWCRVEMMYASNIPFFDC